MFLNMKSNTEMRRLLNSMSWLMIVAPLLLYLSLQFLYPLFSLKSFSFVSFPTLILVFCGGCSIQALIYSQRLETAWQVFLGFTLLIGLFLSQSSLFGWGFTLALNIYATFIAYLIFPPKWQRIIVAACILVFIYMFFRIYFLKGESFIFHGAPTLMSVTFLIFLGSVYLVDTLHKQLLEVYEKLRINEQKLKEQAAMLQEKSDWLEMITGNLPIRIAYVDKQENILFANPELLNTFQLTAADLPIHSQHKMVTNDKSGSVRRVNREKMYETGKPVTFEYSRMFPEDNNEIITQYTYVPHFIENDIVGRIAIGIDITELRQTQKALQNQNDMFSLVLNNISARIVYVHRSGEVIFANEQVENDFGCPLEKIIGGDVQDCIPQAFYQHARPYAAQTFRKKQIVSFETDLAINNKQKIRINMFFYPHIIDDIVQAVFILYMDVTEQRKLENALARSQKLESLGILAGGVAHDFNNLLTAILGQLSVAQYKLDKSHPANRHLEQSISATKQTADLTRQMLAYSGRGSFSVGPLDVNHLIKTNLQLFNISLQINVTLETDLNPDLPLIEADSSQIQQLIMNFVINAGQAIGVDGGEIVVKTAVSKISNDQKSEYWEYTGELKQPGDYVVIQIEDNGAGMDDETIEKIFDPFFTTKEKGSGLGLAAALGIIRGHKGGISVESEPQNGTIFKLYFPVCEPQEFYESKDQIYIAPKIDLLNTILIIDDDLHVLNTVAEMLKVKEIEVLTAPNGQDGLEIYANHRNDISMVVLDLMMPGMSGEEVYEKLKELDPNIKVILSSGYSKVEAMRQFVAKGLADFIQKPYDIETLLATCLRVMQ